MKLQWFECGRCGCRAAMTEAAITEHIYRHGLPFVYQATAIAAKNVAAAKAQR